MIPGSGCRPKYTPRREPETPRGYDRREEYEEERGPRGRGKSVHFPMSLKLDGKSNWKAFYLLMTLGVSCSLPGVCLDLPILSLIREV
jgi:hypothetical protein